MRRCSGWFRAVLLSTCIASRSFAWAPSSWSQRSPPLRPWICGSAAGPPKVVVSGSQSSPEASDARDKVYGWDSKCVERVVEQSAAASEQDVLDFDLWFWGAGQVGGVKQAVFHSDERPVVLFDGVCNFCDASVNFFMEKDSRKEGTFRFAAQQSDVGRILLQQDSGKDPEELKSIVLLTREDMYCKSDAVIRIARELQEPFRSLSYVAKLFPQAVRDRIYEWVSENRKVFGEKNSCRIPEEEEMERFIG